MTSDSWPRVVPPSEVSRRTGPFIYDNRRGAFIDDHQGDCASVCGSLLSEDSGRSHALSQASTALAGPPKPIDKDHKTTKQFHSPQITPEPYPVRGQAFVTPRAVPEHGKAALMTEQAPLRQALFSAVARCEEYEDATAGISRLCRTCLGHAMHSCRPRACSAN